MTDHNKEKTWIDDLINEVPWFNEANFGQITQQIRRQSGNEINEILSQLNELCRITIQARTALSQVIPDKQEAMHTLHFPRIIKSDPVEAAVHSHLAFLTEHHVRQILRDVRESTQLLVLSTMVNHLAELRERFNWEAELEAQRPQKPKKTRKRFRVGSDPNIEISDEQNGKNIRNLATIINAYTAQRKEEDRPTLQSSIAKDSDITVTSVSFASREKENLRHRQLPKYAKWVQARRAQIEHTILTNTLLTDAEKQQYMNAIREFIEDNEQYIHLALNKLPEER